MDSGHVFQIIDTGIGIAPEDIPTREFVADDLEVAAVDPMMGCGRYFTAEACAPY